MTINTALTASGTVNVVRGGVNGGGVAGLGRVVVNNPSPGINSQDMPSLAKGLGRN